MNSSFFLSNRKRIIFIISLILTVFFLAGCWDRREVNDLAIITAAGIDKKTDKTIELTVLVFVPKSSGGQQMEETSGDGGATQLVRSAEGNTIADAMSKLQQEFSRKLFWGHDDVFIIDKELSNEDLRPHLDFILRHPQLRERSHVFISQQKVKKILSLEPPLERSLSEVLRKLAAVKIGMDITVKDLAEMLISDSKAATVPYIKILPPQSGMGKKQTIAYIVGTAVLKEGKMVGYLDESVTRGVLWLRNEIKLAVVTLKPKDTQGFISLNLRNSHSKLVPKIKNGKWKITLKINTEDDIIQNATKLAVLNPKVIKMLEKDLVENIDQRVEEALSPVQNDMNADIFGFADAFHRAYPEIYEKHKNKWDDIFPNIEVTIETRARIHRPGMVTTPSAIPNEEVKNE
ncbi:Ger(x)C family spore germination protein [Neobacillus drentensis]|uniref:Ger(x)C family spore germination protein n=1 Tax=Neobacillus drentensis TaxID=220684 RepID=UPI0030027FC9